MAPLTDQEIESLRIAIAEEMGWKKVGHKWSKKDSHPDFPGELIWPELPEYTTTIDDIQAAAMERFKEADKARFEINFLDPETLNNGKFVFELTALDWAIAFARTAKIWRWKV